MKNVPLLLNTVIFDTFVCISSKWKLSLLTYNLVMVKKSFKSFLRKVQRIVFPKTNTKISGKADRQKPYKGNRISHCAKPSCPFLDSNKSRQGQGICWLL